jgi:hypothetical protein
LDIDRKSRYHNKQSLEKFLQCLSQADLSRSSLYRSSYSGGWHLYFFFDEPVNSADLRAQLFKLLTLNMQSAGNQVTFMGVTAPQVKNARLEIRRALCFGVTSSGCEHLGKK